MTDATANSNGTDAASPAKGSKTGLILGAVLAVAGAGGGYMAVQSGLLFGAPDPGTQAIHEGAGGHGESTDHGGSDHQAAAGGHESAAATIGDPSGMAFVALDPIVISLRDSDTASHLRLRAQLEVAATYKREVERLKPRIVDMMNGYLRALQPGDFEDPLILIRVRSQLLRRMQIIAGDGRVNDVLIMEFVLN